jgi:addiction module HigA family antidote
LHEEFLVGLGINQRALALAIDVPPIRISEIVRGKRAITADTAMRLAAFFGTSPEFWLNLQSQWELSKLRKARAGDYAFINRVTKTSV